MNRNSILFISLFFFSLNVAAQSIYEGKLGGKYGVVIQLVRGEKRGNITEMEGAYYYTSKGPDNLIYLSGTWNRSNQDFVIEEYENSIPVGVFKGKFTNYGMEGIHTNYARNSKLNFKLKRTQSASQSIRQDFGTWETGYKLDRFGDATKIASAQNFLEEQDDRMSLVLFYDTYNGLEIAPRYKWDFTFNNYTTVTIKRKNGSVEKLICSSKNGNLYVSGSELKKFAQIMEEGNFKMLIELRDFLDNTVINSFMFVVGKKLEGAIFTFKVIDTENSKR